MSAPASEELGWEIRGGGTDAPAVLFIPPLGRGRASWESQVAALESAHRCVVFDPRGIGNSLESPDGSYSVSTVAQDAADVLDQVGLRRAHVVGWSLGAAAATVLALNDPDRVASLTLVTPWARTDTHLATAFRIMRDLAAHSSAESVELATLWLILSRQAINESGDQLVVGARSDVVASGYPTPETLCRYLDSAISFDVLDALGSLTAATLVVGGANDRLVDVSHAREVAATIPGARLHVLEGARSTHAFPMERGSELNELISTFIAQAQNSPG